MTMCMMLKLGGAFAAAVAGLFLGASHSIHVTNEHVGVAIALGAVFYAYRQIGRHFDAQDKA